MPDDLLRHDKLFIGGDWVSPGDGDVVASINPSTGKEWATAAFAGTADIDRAVAAANEAFRGPWRKMTGTDRSNILRRLGDLYAANVGRLAELESHDNGMPIRDSRAGIAGHPQYYYYYSGLAANISGRNIQLDPAVHVYTTREPVGVVGMITPWNAPLQTVMWKMAPALAAGCTMVIKPAEQTPITAFELARLAAEAGVPPGVINVVPGLGATAGAHLVAHPNVNKISFTGEHHTAMQIMRGAAVNLKRLSFETGGKSPHIIFDDADLEQAINAATHSAFALCGQSCALGSRLLVHESVYDKVVNEIASRSTRVRIGNALDPATQMGPQAHDEQLQKTLRYLDIGKQEGARLVVGGERINELGDGYFVKPTVFADVTNSMRIAREEIFGPVVGVIKFKTEEEAVAIANDTEYGLVAGLWTKNIGRAHRVAAQIQAGMVWVNTYRYIRYNIPYGGYKISGNGANGCVPHSHCQQYSVAALPDQTAEMRDAVGFVNGDVRAAWPGGNRSGAPLYVQYANQCPTTPTSWTGTTVTAVPSYLDAPASGTGAGQVAAAVTFCAPSATLQSGDRLIVGYAWNAQSAGGLPSADQTGEITAAGPNCWLFEDNSIEGGGLAQTYLFTVTGGHGDWEFIQKFLKIYTGSASSASCTLTLTGAAGASNVMQYAFPKIEVIPAAVTALTDEEVANRARYEQLFSSGCATNVLCDPKTGTTIPY